MATSAPRPIPQRPGAGYHQRRSSYPPWNAPQSQYDQPPEPRQYPQASTRASAGGPPPTAPLRALPPPEWYDYGPPPHPPGPDPYSSSPRSYATTPGVGYSSSRPQHHYGFPPQQTYYPSYTPPNPSQYQAATYGAAPPQQHPQSKPHPQDAYARDAYDPRPPQRVGPPPAGRRRGTDSAPEWVNVARDGGRRRGTMDDSYARPPRRHRPRRMSYDSRDTFVGEPFMGDFEEDYPTRRYDHDEQYDDAMEDERWRRHEERKQEKRRRRQQSASDKAISTGGRASHSFGDSVFWVLDTMKDKLR